jgi:hypothetical protein
MSLPTQNSNIPNASETAGPSDTTGPNIAARKREYDEVFDDDSGEWDKFTIVRVGQEAKEFFVHTHCLRKIPFFQACLDSGMEESTSGIVKLPEDHPAAFGIVAHWLYHGVLPWSLEDLTGAAKDASTKLGVLVHAWYLADMLMMEALHNVLIDYLTELGNDIDWAYFAMILGIGYRNSAPYKLSLAQLSSCIRAAGGWVKFKESKEHACFRYASLSVESMEFVCEALSGPIATKITKKQKCTDYHKHVDTKKC